MSNMKLIDKDEVGVEIKRRIALLENNSNGTISMLASGMFVNEYKDLLSFLDTIEVKDVDLEKEYKEFINCNNGRSMFETAKHFFELGLKHKKNNKAMKELDELKEKCVQAMKDVDALVDEHYEELCNEIREQWNVPEDWIVKIVSNCGVVHGCYRQTNKDEWFKVIYDNGLWLDNNIYI